MCDLVRAGALPFIFLLLSFSSKRYESHGRLAQDGRLVILYLLLIFYVSRIYINDFLNSLI